MKRKTSVLKEKAQEWHKQEILKAARAVFVRKGYHRTTMDDVAGELGGSKGALYLYFASKDDIFMALVDQAIAGRRNLVEQIFHSRQDSIAKIRSYVENTFDYFENNRDLVSMFMMLERDILCSDLHKEIHNKATTMMIQTMNTLTAIMKQGIKEGVLKRGDPERMAVAFGGMVQIFEMRAMLQDIKISARREADFIMTMFLNGVKKERTN